MAKDVLITPNLGLIEFFDTLNVSKSLIEYDETNNIFKLSAESGTNIGLIANAAAIQIGDTGSNTSLIFKGAVVLKPAANDVLYLGSTGNDGNLTVRSQFLLWENTFSAFGIFDTVGFPSSYNTNLATLVGGTTKGTLIRGAQQGHVVIALHGNDANDTFSIVSYTVDTSPSVSVAPNKLLFRLSRDGNLRLGNYTTAGILTNDASGNVSSLTTLPISQGGTNRTTAPTSNKFLIYDGTRFEASLFDQNSFAKLGSNETVTGTWVFNNPVNASISGNAATATLATTAATATSAGKWTTVRTFTFTGDVTASFNVDGSANISTDLTLSNTGVTPGTWTSVTVDAKGRVTAGSSASISNASTLNGLSDTSFLRTDADTTKTAGYLIINPAGTKSVIRISESTGKAAFAVSVKDNSAYLAIGTYFDGTNWKQQNSGATGLSSILRLDPQTGAIWFAASGVGEGSNITTWNISNGLVLWTTDGKWSATRLTGTIPSGNLSGTYSISISGNAGTATSATSATTATSSGKWTVARTLTLGGDLSGSTPFDGSADFSLSATLGSNKISYLQTKEKGGRGAALNRDPFFTDTSAWTLTNASFVGVTNGYANNIVVRSTGVPASLESPNITFDRSRSLLIRYSLRKDAGGSNRACQPYLLFKDGNGVTLESSPGITKFYFPTGTSEVPTGTTWQLEQHKFPVASIPVTAVFVVVGLDIATGGSTGVNDIDFVVLTHQLATLDIADLAITGAHVALNTLDNSHFSSGTYANITGIGTLTGLTVNGTVTATTFSGALSGNASTATVLQNARTIALSGDVTATGVSFNGSTNITISTVVASLPAISGVNLTSLNASNLGSGTVPSARISGAYTGFSNITYSGQLTSSVAIGTAPIVVTSTTLNTNLNADLLDGQHASAFSTTGHTHTIENITGLPVPGGGNATNYIRINAAGTAYESRTTAELGLDLNAIPASGGTMTGKLTFSMADPEFELWDTSAPTDSKRWRWIVGNTTLSLDVLSDSGTVGPNPLVLTRSTTSLNSIAFGNVVLTPSGITISSNTVYHAGNFVAGTNFLAPTGNGSGLTNINASNLGSGTVPSARLTGSYTIDITGNAATATSAGKWTTARTFTFSGDLTGSSSIDGSTAPNIALTLNTVATAGTYKSVTVDAKGRVTAGTNPTTLAGYGIVDAAALSHTHAFSTLTSIPTTLAGYGITDAAALSHTHTFASLTSKPTTISGFGITDGLTSTGGTMTGNLQIGSADTASQTILLPKGTDLLPALTFIGDANTGLFSPAADQIGLTVGGKGILVALSNLKLRLGDSDDALRQMFFDVNLSTSFVPYSSAISTGGSWNNDGTFTTVTTGANVNAAVSIGFNTFNTTTNRITFFYVPPTAGGLVQTSVTPEKLLELATPSGVTIPKNYLRITASATGLEPILESVGTDTNIGLLLKSKGSSVTEPVKVQGHFAVDSSFNAVFGGADAVSTNRVSIYDINLSVGSNQTNGLVALNIENNSLDIASTFTDSGHRTGFRLDDRINTPFAGTLALRRGAFIYYGDNTGATGGGTVSTYFGLYLSGNKAGNTTFTTVYGLYETATGLTVKNYLGSNTIFGSETGYNSEKVYVAGALTATGVTTLKDNLILSGSKIELTGYIYEKYQSNNIIIYKNVATYHSAASSVTGIIKIALPVSWTGTNIRVRLLVIDLSSNATTEVVVTGYNPASAWQNTSVFMDSTIPGQKVRLGHDGTKNCILLGATGTNWSYPKVVIKEVSVSQASQTAFETGWAFSVITSETGLTGLVEPSINANFPSGAYSTSVASNPDTIPVRDSNADITTYRFKSEFNTDTTTFDHIVVQVERGGGAVDNALKPASLTSFKTHLSNNRTGLIAQKADILNTARTISLTGPVTGSVSFDGSGNVSIATTLTSPLPALNASNLTNVPASQLIGSVPNGRLSGSYTGITSIEALTFTGALTGNATTATTLQNARTIGLSGDITAAGISFNGSANITLTTTIGTDKVLTTHILDSNVTYAKIQNVTATNRFLGRITAGAGNIEELTAANAWTILGVIPNANFSGTYSGITSITSTSFVGALTGNASTATTLQNARTIAISGDVTGTATSFNGSANITISSTITAGAISNSHINAAAAIPYSKLQDVSATSRVLGRITAGAGDIEELTSANLWTLLGTVPDANLSGTYTGLILSASSLTLTNGNFGVSGDATSRLHVLRNSTTNNTITELFLDGSTTRLVLANDTTWHYTIKLVARRTDVDGENHAWTLTGLVYRNANAASTVVVEALTEFQTTSSWIVTVSADTTNGALRIQVTGETSKTIRWVAFVNTVEVTG